MLSSAIKNNIKKIVFGDKTLPLDPSFKCIRRVYPAGLKGVGRPTLLDNFKVRFSVVSPSTSLRTNGERSRTISPFLKTPPLNVSGGSTLVGNRYRKAYPCGIRKVLYTFLHHKKITLIALILFALTSPLFSQDNESDKATGREESQDLSELQRQARSYRNQGLELQRIGNLEGAMSLYQKAIELDPMYAVAYNDLGIIYEAKGLFERAEDSYLKAIKIDPNYLSVYSNLALVYEHQRNLDKASFYWEKRAKLGSPDDPWTQKAKQRLGDIYLMLGKANEFEALDLMEEITKQKSINRENDRELANSYFRKAKLSYKKGNYALALKEALSASQIDPSNHEVEKFIEKVLKRLLSK